MRSTRIGTWCSRRRAPTRCAPPSTIGSAPSGRRTWRARRRCGRRSCGGGCARPSRCSRSGTRTWRGPTREETLALVSEFLCARAEAAADDAAPGALATLLERVRAAAGVDGVYRPRRRCEPSVLRFGGAEREVVLKECAAEMALFGYEIDAAKGDALGTVVGDGPKSIYLEAGGAEEMAARGGGAGCASTSARASARPRTRAACAGANAVESKRDESLLSPGAGRPCGPTCRVAASIKENPARAGSRPSGITGPSASHFDLA